MSLESLVNTEMEKEHFKERETDPEGFRQVINTKIDHIEQAIQNLTNGIASRVENHQDRLTKLETSIEIMSRVAWVAIGASVVAIITAMSKMILK